MYAPMVACGPLQCDEVVQGLQAGLGPYIIAAVGCQCHFEYFLLVAGFSFQANTLLTFLPVYVY